MAKKKSKRSTPSKKTARNPGRQAGSPTRASRNEHPKAAGSAGAKRPKKKRSSPKKTDPRQRLQRVMAAAGIASRRECEIIIQEGRVEVDGNIVVELGCKVDPEKQEIFVDAERLVIEPLQYFILNKPPGVISTSQDPAGRARVIDLIETRHRVYNVGRLDKSSEGLILVTNDGVLAHRLTHPRYGIEKKYHVQVDGRPTQAALRQLQDGVYLAEGRVRASNIRYLKKSKTGSWLEIVLDEGRNREIRRMLAAIGHKVRTLKRVAIGPLKLADLPVGAHRALTKQEIKSLKSATSGGAKPKRKSAKARGRAVGAGEVRAIEEERRAKKKAKAKRAGKSTSGRGRRSSTGAKVARARNRRNKRK